MAEPTANDENCSSFERTIGRFLRWWRGFKGWKSPHATGNTAVCKLMVPVAPAWDNNRTSPTEPLASRGHRNTTVAATGECGINLCYPALAAAITQDAERLCSQQVSCSANAAW